MKHLLSILVIALAFTATTASAAFTYEVARTGFGDWHHPQDYDGMDSYYTIRVTGGSGEIWLSDWIDTAYGAHQVDNLTNKGIEYYGYQYVNSNDQSKVDGSTVKYKVGVDTTPISAEDFTNPENGQEITRFKYYLGTFSEGDEVAIYMKDENGGEVWSNTAYWLGGYNAGTNVDELKKYQLGYYSKDPEPDYNAKEAIVAAAMKALPLASLDTDRGHRVFFVISGAESSGNEAAGAPLPGGLAISLVAGLFALGFWYVRRRNAVAV